MKLAHILAALAAAFTLTAAAAPTPPIAHVTEGALRGERREDGSALFRAIPVAQGDVDDVRAPAALDRLCPAVADLVAVE